ncbi:MAG TPA: hypothetical protein VK420_01280 [Longimicrobium sp.]|nr:hypothetical protein [Longimicrobium sp.]
MVRLLRRGLESPADTRVTCVANATAFRREAGEWWAGAAGYRSGGPPGRFLTD